jgi:hypothetical protein
MYSSPNIISMIKLRRVRWASTGHMQNGYKMWLESLKGRGHSEGLGIDGMKM